MKNIITLQKDGDGNIYCSQVTEAGKEYAKLQKESSGYWENGGTITLDEIEEILDKDI